MKSGTIIEGPYLSDLLAQSLAIRSTALGLARAECSDLRRLVAEPRPRVVLTGMGSSFHALHPLVLRLASEGRAPLMVETSELIRFQRGLIGRESLLVAVSQSGRSAETVRLLRMARGRCPIIGITNTPSSPLGKQADAVILTAAGEEHSVSCKTYVATLAAVAWLGDVFAARASRLQSQLSAAARFFDDYLRQWRRHVTNLSPQLRGARHLFLAGRGISLAAVGTGGLIIKEAAHFLAEGMSSAALRHGPLEMIGPGSAVLLFEGRATAARLHQRLAAELRGAGAKVLLAGDSGRGALRLPAVPDATRPLLEILPVQMITLALASLDGREAGRFDSATKVTTTE